MASKGLASPRQVVWTALRELAGEELQNDVSLKAITDRTGVVPKTARDYLACLIAGSYIAAVEAPTATYRLIRDAGVHAPRLRADGTPVTQGAATTNMWRSMRTLSKFSYRDIALHSNTTGVAVSEESAKAYCKILLATGYLKVVQKAAPTDGRIAIYRLIRNDGPKPPMVQRVKQIFDPNTGRVYRQEGN